jgi:hypothetical protein
MSEKEIYKALNNVSIDEHEFDDIDVCMTDIQKNKLKINLKTNIKTKKFKKSKIAAATAAALILFVGFGWANPSFAAQIPFLNPIVEMLGHTGDYANYSDIVNKTVTYNGKSFTINSVVCFDNNIIIGYTAKSNTKIDSADPLFFPTFKINNKWLNVGTTGGAENVNDKTVTGTIELMPGDDITLPDNFNFAMSFNKFDGTAGNWDIKFNISKAELSKSTKMYKPNKVLNFGDHTFTINKVYLTPLDTVISLHSNIKHPSKTIIPGFIVLDDKGNELIGESATGMSSSDGYNETICYSKINQNAKYLTIMPVKEHGQIYNMDNNTVSGIPDSYITVPINTKLPFDIPEGNNGKVTITKTKFSNDNDKVSIQGFIYGKFPMCQTFTLQGDNPKADISAVNPTIKKVGTDKYEFTQEYSGLNNDKNYKLIAPNLDYIDYNSRITLRLN